MTMKSETIDLRSSSHESPEAMQSYPAVTNNLGGNPHISREMLDAAFDARFPQDVKEKLQNARVAIAGLGGLGSNIAVMLARSGVGHMLLLDYDVVDITNLNRQMYNITHIGKPKTEALSEIIAGINPYLDITIKTVKLTEDNIPDLLNGYPIICEAFDQPDQKATLVNTVLRTLPDAVIVSGNGMAGYGDANTIQTKRQLSRLYVCGDGTADIAAGMGLMAPRVAICAGHQANKVIQLILE